MKSMFGLLSLLLALAVVGVLVKKQLGGVSGGTGPAPQEQSQQIQQQFKQSLDAAMQQTRPMPEDK